MMLISSEEDDKEKETDCFADGFVSGGISEIAYGPRVRIEEPSSKTIYQQWIIDKYI